MRHIQAVLAMAGTLLLIVLTNAPAFSEFQTTVDREQAKKLRNPMPFNKESINRGRILFSRGCTECHGADAKSTVDVVANATDLTEPKLWRSGTSAGEVFRSIRDGAGDGMPPFKAQYKEEDLWHLVNFIQSLWPDEHKPKLVQ